MKYFDHDTSARRDEKIRVLRNNFDGAAVDCYYALIEFMYENENDFNLDNMAEVFSFCFDLQIDKEKLCEWLDFMCEIKLLERDANVIFSTRVHDSLEKFRETCEQKRKGGAKGGRAHTGKTTKKEAYAKHNLSKCADNKVEDKLKIEKEKEKEIKRENEIIEIVSYLNQKTGKSFKTNPVSQAACQLIGARLDEEFTVEDCKQVIDNKCATWLDDPKMNGFLRPTTLFAPNKFEEYLNEKGAQDGEAEWPGWLAPYMDDTKAYA